MVTVGLWNLKPIDNGSRRFQEYIKEQESLGKMNPALIKVTLSNKRTNIHPADRTQIDEIYEETRSDRG